MATRRIQMPHFCGQSTVRKSRRKRASWQGVGEKGQHKVDIWAEVLQNCGLRAGNKLFLSPRLRICDSKRIGHIDAVRH